MPLPMYEESKKSRIAKTVAVAAGKGGVGKSTVAVNMARALKKKGLSVGIMDTDVYGPSVRKLMPEDRMPNVKEGVIIPALSEGIRVISLSYFRDEEQAAVVRAPVANGIVTQFLEQVAWGELDFLIIDFPPGTGDIQLTLCQKANITAGLIVTTPQEIAMMDVRKAMNMFDLLQIPLLGVVENMSGYWHAETQEVLPLFGSLGGSKLAAEKGVPFLGSIPFDPALSVKSDLGKSIFAGDQNELAVSAQAFLQIAEASLVHLTGLLKKEKDCLHSFELTWQEIP